MRLAEILQCGQNCLKHGLDALRHRWRPRGIGDEVRHTGDDAAVGLVANGSQGLSKELDVATWDDLRRLHQGIGAASVLVHMTMDVRVAQQREHVHLGHLDELAKRRRDRNDFSMRS